MAAARIAPPATYGPGLVPGEDAEVERPHPLDERPAEHADRPPREQVPGDEGGGRPDA